MKNLMRIKITEEQYKRTMNALMEAKPSDVKMEEFANTRLGGAEKIVDNAEKKGGLAMLTYHHFKVKLPYYEKAKNGKLKMEDAKKEYHKLLDKFYSATKGDMNIEQIAFQELLGKLEVLGELIIKQK
jgi:hypothetical protein